MGSSYKIKKMPSVNTLCNNNKFITIISVLSLRDPKGMSIAMKTLLDLPTGV